MHFSTLKKTGLVFTFLFSAFIAKSQFIETFENQPPNQRSFTSNGQVFNLSNAFKIYSSRNGIGYQHSNRFIDNIANTQTNQTNSISTPDGKTFSVKQMWIFTSSDGGDNPTTDGQVQVIGKRNGVVVFSFTKSTGFNSDFSQDAGFTLLNLATDGGADYSNLVIDEIVFVLHGSFDYLAIDNFTWQPNQILPVNIISFTGLSNDNGSVTLNWQSSLESNANFYKLEKSQDGNHFTTVGTEKATGNSTSVKNYSFTDNQPFTSGTYYRLTAVDLDGQTKQHGVIFVRTQKNSTGASIYPNPVTGSTLYVKFSKNTASLVYVLVDMGGKAVQNGMISGMDSKINVSNLSRGKYFLRLSDGRILPWIKN